MRLTLLLNRLLVEPGHGELFFAPIGVEVPALQLFTDSLPVRLGVEAVGEIDLAEVFGADQG